MSDHQPTHTPDAWSSLRRHTAARIALGRAGGSLPTAELLDFAMAHAAARDAVQGELDVAALIASLGPLTMPWVRLKTQALDRLTYLQRPDLGRRLVEASRASLHEMNGNAFDVSLIVADGLSAPAAQSQAAPLLLSLFPLLRESGFTLAPLCIVTQARVAVQDEIGFALGAKAALILIGERPGLGTAQSLGAYLVFNPRPGNTDAQRNCVSNIRPDGLPPVSAAVTLRYLIRESLRRKISGVALKDGRAAPDPKPSTTLLPAADIKGDG
jgi:ethanolamine ammonia-lyase small subunit